MDEDVRFLPPRPSTSQGNYPAAAAVGRSSAEINSSAARADGDDTLVLERVTWNYDGTPTNTIDTEVVQACRMLAERYQGSSALWTEDSLPFSSFSSLPMMTRDSLPTMTRDSLPTMTRDTLPVMTEDQLPAFDSRVRRAFPCAAEGSTLVVEDPNKLSLSSVSDDDAESQSSGQLSDCSASRDPESHMERRKLRKAESSKAESRKAESRKAEAESLKARPTFGELMKRQNCEKLAKISMISSGSRREFSDGASSSDDDKTGAMRKDWRRSDVRKQLAEEVRNKLFCNDAPRLISPFEHLAAIPQCESSSKEGTDGSSLCSMDNSHNSHSRSRLPSACCTRDSLPKISDNEDSDSDDGADESRLSEVDEGCVTPEDVVAIVSKSGYEFRTESTATGSSGSAGYPSDSAKSSIPGDVKTIWRPLQNPVESAGMLDGSATFPTTYNDVTSGQSWPLSSMARVRRKRSDQQKSAEFSYQPELHPYSSEPCRHQENLDEDTSKRSGSVDALLRVRSNEDAMKAWHERKATKKQRRINGQPSRYGNWLRAQTEQLPLGSSSCSGSTSVGSSLDQFSCR